MVARRTTPPGPFPVVPTRQVEAMTRIAVDAFAQSSRLWIDLWFANAQMASTAFWRQVERTARER